MSSIPAPKIKLQLNASSAAVSSSGGMGPMDSSSQQQQQQSPPGYPATSTAPSESGRHAHRQVKTTIKLTHKADKNNPADSDEEFPNILEEHLILRMPRGDPLTERLRTIVKNRSEFPDDFQIQWLDARRGILQWGQEKLTAKLVDLPTTLESQKTLDHKQFYKVADICQMIQIERPANDDISSFSIRPLSTDETTSNSGITPPMKYCRVRRFRKRVSRRTVESIEKEVARLLKDDAEALEVETKILEPHELEERLAAADRDEEEYDEDGQQETLFDDEERERSDEVDMEFAAELEDEISKAVAMTSSDEESEDEDDEEEEEEGQEEYQEGEGAADADQEEEDEEDDELRGMLVQQRLLRDEMKDLEEKISEKQNQRNRALNAIMQKRFDDIIKKLQAEMDLKQRQMQDLDEEIENRRGDLQDADYAAGGDGDEEENEGDDTEAIAAGPTESSK